MKTEEGRCSKKETEKRQREAGSRRRGLGEQRQNAVQTPRKRGCVKKINQTELWRILGEKR